jgi:catechol 2,3-dioxygenase-like lactoylglutathione lyase family enzyme
MKLSACLAFTLLLFLSGYAEDFGLKRMSSLQGESEPVIRTYGVKINVDDMEKALAFYCGKLGFEIEDRGAYPNQVILKADDSNKLILNRVKRLVAPGDDDTRLSFTLQVNDLDQAIDKMRSLGVEFGEAERRREGVGSAIYIKDPFGRLISLMHQTIVKVEPFKEPKLYNFGFLVPDMERARDFYSNKLGFVSLSERYLPKDLPLGHRDKTFAFMLHYRQGVEPVRSDYPNGASFNTLVFETNNLRVAVKALKARGVNILDKRARKTAAGSYVTFADPFGNVSELLERSK